MIRFVTIQFGNSGWLKLYNLSMLRARQVRGINAFDPEIELLNRS